MKPGVRDISLMGAVSPASSDIKGGAFSMTKIISSIEHHTTESTSRSRHASLPLLIVS